MATIELGGNIALTGFEGIEPVQMIVLKKIVGSSVKGFAVNAKGYKRFELILEKVGDQKKIKAILTAEPPVEAEGSKTNLFDALAVVIKIIETSLK